MNKLTSVRTKTRSHTRNNGEKSYMSREIVGFYFKNRLNKFVSIIQEVAFEEQETDEMTLNENNELVPTGNKITKRVFLEVIREISRDVKAEQSDTLFTAIGEDIKTTESFVQRFLDDQRVGLMMDSNATKFGTVPLNEFVVDDFNGNYVNKAFNANHL